MPVWLEISHGMNICMSLCLRLCMCECAYLHLYVFVSIAVRCSVWCWGEEHFPILISPPLLCKLGNIYQSKTLHTILWRTTTTTTTAKIFQNYIPIQTATQLIKAGTSHNSIVFLLIAQDYHLMGCIYKIKPKMDTKPVKLILNKNEQRTSKNYY